MVLSIQVRTNGDGVTVVDVLFILFSSIFTYFVVQAWQSVLAPTFFSISFGLIAIYLIAMFTGSLKFLKITKPTWTVSALISIPMWFLVARISSSSTQQNFDEDNPLVRLFSLSFMNNSVQSYIVPLYETVILVGLIVGLVMLSRNKNIDKFSNPVIGLRKEKKSFLPLLLIFIGSIGGLIHYAIAFILQDQGTIGFNAFLAHQFISFYIFALMSLIFGLNGGIASHMVKNLIVYGTGPIIIGFFIFFILMDIISYYTTPKQNKRQIIQGNVPIGI